MRGHSIPDEISNFLPIFFLLQSLLTTKSLLIVVNIDFFNVYGGTSNEGELAKEILGDFRSWNVKKIEFA